MRKSPLLLLLLATAALFIGAVWKETRYAPAIFVHPSRRTAAYQHQPIRSAVLCLVGEHGVGEVTAPIELGWPMDVEVPADRTGQCYAFTIGFDLCSGRIQYADALTELGPLPCPKEG